MEGTIRSNNDHLIVPKVSLGQLNQENKIPRKKIPQASKFGKNPFLITLQALPEERLKNPRANIKLK